MDFGLSFRYVFKDEAWFKKLAVPALWGLIPVVGVLVLGGWGLKEGQMIMNGQEDNELPKVEFSTDLRIGFFASVIDLCYLLPAVIFFTITVVLARSGLNTQGLTSMLLILLGVMVGLVGLVLFILWFLVGSAAFANFLAKDHFGAAFNFKQLYELLRNSLGSWLLVILGQFVAMMIIAPLGIVFFGIGLLFTTAFGAVFYSHLLSQAYLKSIR